MWHHSVCHSWKLHACKHTSRFYVLQNQSYCWLLLVKVLHCGKRNFCVFAHVTLNFIWFEHCLLSGDAIIQLYIIHTYELNPYTLRCTTDQKWTLHVEAFERYRITIHIPTTDIDKTTRPLTPVRQAKLALGGKAVRAGMDTTYKSAGVQPPQFPIEPNRS